MKYLMTILCLFATNAMAHEDHTLNSNFHVAYHIAFWTLCALVAYKGVVWFKAKKSRKL